MTMMASESAKPTGLSYTHVLAAAGVLFIVLSMLMMPCIPDDAYISFRYAENLADGRGLTFNQGEPPVEAYSNLLWVLLCAVIYRFGMDLPTVTPMLGLILGILIFQSLATLFRQRLLPAWQAAIPLLLLAASGPFILYMISGLETALFTLLLITMLIAADRFVNKPDLRGSAWLLLCGCLAALTRPEGVILFPVAALMLVRASERRRPLLIASGVFVLLAVAYNVWRVSYFGEWMPTPFLSKGGGGAGLIDGWVTNLQVYFVNGGDRWQVQGFYYLLLLMVGVSGLAISRSNNGNREVEKLAMVLALVLAAAYFNFVDWMPGMRYHVPLIPLLLLPGVHLLSLPADRFHLNPGQKKLFFAVSAAVVLVFSAYGAVGIYREAVRINTGHSESRIPLGLWLRGVLPPGALLAMSDVGVTPYYSRLRTLDINTESLTDIHIAKNGYSDQYVLGRKPGAIVLVSRGVYSAKMDPLHFSLQKSRPFLDAYIFIGTSRCEWDSDRCYWVYFRNNVPLTRESLANFPAGIGNQSRLGFEL